MLMVLFTAYAWMITKPQRRTGAQSAACLPTLVLLDKHTVSRPTKVIYAHRTHTPYSKQEKLGATRNTRGKRTCTKRNDRHGQAAPIRFSFPIWEPGTSTRHDQGVGLTEEGPILGPGVTGAHPGRSNSHVRLMSHPVFNAVYLRVATHSSARFSPRRNTR